MSGGLRAAYLGPMFRYERPQRGRFRQFTQCGVEVLGDDSVEADVDVLVMAGEFLRAAGLPPPGTRLVTMLNSLGDAESRERYETQLLDFLSAHRGDLSATSAERLKRGAVLRVLDSKAPEDREIVESAPVSTAALSVSSARRHAALERLLEASGVEAEAAPRLVRGLDYYSDCVFEVELRATDAAGDEARRAADAAHLGTVLAGGRYDGLTSRFGAPASPGLGWASGLDRVAMLRAMGPLPAEERPPTLLHVLWLEGGQDGAARAAAAIRALIEREHCDAAVVSRGPARKLGKALASSAAAGATHAIIVGDDEARGRMMTVRDLRARRQQTVQIDDGAGVLALLGIDK